MSIAANATQTKHFRRPSALAAMLVSLVLVATGCGSSNSANNALSLNGENVSVDRFEKMILQLADAQQITLENGQATGSYPTKCFIIWRFDKNINTRTTIADGQNCAYDVESYSYTIDQEKVIIEGYTYIFENFVQNQDGVSFSLRGIDSQGQTENVFKFYR